MINSPPTVFRIETLLRTRDVADVLQHNFFVEIMSLVLHQNTFDVTIPELFIDIRFSDLLKINIKNK